MTRILYLYNTTSKFVGLDEQLLRCSFDVQSVHLQKRGLHLLPQMWEQTRNIDAVVAWFASWHSLPGFMAARLRGIPRILITGGYDVAREEAIDYGLRRGGLPSLVSEGVFRLTTLALPFSEAARRETLQNTPLTPDRTIALPLGVPDQAAYQQPVRKERIALTIATLDSKSIPRKGVQTFVEAAHHLPDVSFYVVGKARDSSVQSLKVSAPPNVTFTGYLPDEELYALQNRAGVYVQASVHEGFGLAVAESMLARCVPVVSRRGSLPEVAGDCGIYTDMDTPSVAEAIQAAFDADSAMREKGRERILRRFPLDARAAGLRQQIETVIDASR
jgi:glycosyltransferase involved in cell wall biosynthesis